MKKILGYGISVPVLLFGALGNFHLYKESGDVLGSLRNVIILITSIGVELAILFLIHSLTKKTNEITNLITGWLLALVIPVSLMGQYSYLLKEASRKTEAVQMAKGSLDTLALDKAALMAEKGALQGERELMVKTLERESTSGYGPKAKAIKSDIEGIDTKIDAVNTKIESLGNKVESKQVESLEVTELSVLAKEFGLDANGFMKVMVGIFLTIANALGFWLVYLGDLAKVVTVKVKPKAKKKANMTKEKEPMTERVILTKDQLPVNVVQFPSDMVG